jgi:dTDP-4-dehydrorhamnose 3,5-epimerase
VRAEPTAIPGATVLRLDRHVDARGDFVKVFQRSVYETNGLDPTLAEVYWSTSGHGVIRGLHLQLPPSEHAKTVTVIRGAIHDVVVDLRVGSPTFHEHVAITLSDAEPCALQVPVGCAHGFQVTSSEDAVVAYLVATEHDPERDTGVRWDSAGIEWPVADPIVSARDAALPALHELDAPFRFHA